MPGIAAENDPVKPLAEDSCSGQQCVRLTDKCCFLCGMSHQLDLFPGDNSAQAR